MLYQLISNNCIYNISFDKDCKSITLEEYSYISSFIINKYYLSFNKDKILWKNNLKDYSVLSFLPNIILELNKKHKEFIKLSVFK